MTVLAGCDVGIPPGDDATRGADRPPLQLGVVTGTASYKNGKPAHIALSQSSLTNGIELSASFRLFFDRFVLPTTAIRQAVCLHPSATTVVDSNDCSEPFQPFTAPEYNPVRREVVYRLSPGVRLAPSTQYRLSVFSAADAASNGLRAFDGEPLARTLTFDFTTKADGSTAQDEPGPSREKYCLVQSCFRACASAPDVDACKFDCRPLCLDAECEGEGDLLAGFVPAIFGACAFSPCHSASAETRAPMGLDLARKSLIAATAIGVVAHGSATGEAAHLPEPSGPKFGRAMALIAPDDPGQSYLLYKLISNPLNHPKGDAALDRELVRLRGSVVVGLPMPAENGEPRGLVGGTDKDGNALDPGGSKSHAALQLINDWIAHGAVVDCAE
ncbi:MAG: hypothetical protein EXR75_08270 [Myxococcales bacterium]|nr:hypothetical protein [Myxococcales bacterium]